MVRLGSGIVCKLSGTVLWWRRDRTGCSRPVGADGSGYVGVVSSAAVHTIGCCWGRKIVAT
jgi:hypothetical protein